MSLFFRVLLLPLLCQCLTIDTVIRDGVGPGGNLWVDSNHGVKWRSVTQKIDKLLKVYSPTTSTVPIPLNGICGPRALDTSANFTLEPRHIGPNGMLKMPSNDSLIIYIYTDVYNGNCMDGTTIAYAQYCQSEPGTMTTPRGRPLLGYINLCLPDYGVMETVLMHELLHVLGFNPVIFSSIFPNYDTYGTLGRIGGSLIPFVRNHYGCAMGSPGDSFFYGFPTYNLGHMNPFLVGDETMDPCISYVNDLKVTELTSHILADLGAISDSGGVFTPFYTVNHSVAEKFWYGYMRGCNFDIDICPSYSITFPPNTVKCVDLCYSDLFIVPVSEEGAIGLADQSILSNWIDSGSNDMVLYYGPVETSGYSVSDIVLVSLGMIVGGGLLAYFFWTYWNQVQRPKTRRSGYHVLPQSDNV